MEEKSKGDVICLKKIGIREKHITFTPFKLGIVSSSSTSSTRELAFHHFLQLSLSPFLRSSPFVHEGCFILSKQLKAGATYNRKCVNGKTEVIVQSNHTLQKSSYGMVGSLDISSVKEQLSPFQLPLTYIQHK